MAAKKTVKKSQSTSTSTVDSRSQFIDVALRIILERGIDAVRLEDILAEVGVTKGSLYWHFEDRNALVKAAIAEHIRRLSAEMVEGMSEAISSTLSKDDYLARVSTFIANPYDKDQVRERWGRLGVLVESRNDPELSAMMRDVQARHLAVMVELMTEAQKNGKLRADLDPRAVAVALTAMNLGSNIIDVLGDDAPDPGAWWGLLSFFIGSLFPPDKG
ncbi:MAG: TetR/AcrR family transcriptional regulator [Actinomycetota bacterium]